MIDPGMSSAQAYKINKQCFAGWSGVSEAARSNGEIQKQTLSRKAAEAALERGIAAGAADGISADQVRVDFEGRAAITKQNERAAAHDVLICSFVYPPPERAK